MSHPMTQPTRPEAHPQSIHDNYVSSCHAVYDTLTAAEKKAFKYAVKDNSDFKNLVIVWRREHDPRSPEFSNHAQAEMQLKAEVRRIIDCSYVRSKGPTLIPDDFPKTASQRLAQAGSSKPTAAAAGPESSRSLVMESRSQSGPTAARSSGCVTAPPSGDRTLRRSVQIQSRTGRPTSTFPGEPQSSRSPAMEPRSQKGSPATFNTELLSTPVSEPRTLRRSMPIQAQAQWPTSKLHTESESAGSLTMEPRSQRGSPATRTTTLLAAGSVGERTVTRGPAVRPRAREEAPTAHAQPLGSARRARIGQTSSPLEGRDLQTDSSQGSDGRGNRSSQTCCNIR